MKKDKSKTLAVVIPVYNAETYIKKCIDKVLKIPIDKEIIVINDGSTDKSLNILRKYKDQIILINSNKNIGLSAARNVGIKKSTAEYITFIDVDDDFEIDVYPKMLEKIIISDSDICIFNFDIIEKKGSVLHSNCSNNIQEGNVNSLLINFLTNQMITGVWSSIFRTKMAKNILFDENVRIGEDILFMLRYLLHIKKFVFSKDVVYHYYQNDNSMMHNISCKLTEYYKIPVSLRKDEQDFLINHYLNEFDYFKLDMIKKSVHSISLASKKNKKLAASLLKQCCTKNDCINIIKNNIIPRYIRFEFWVIKNLGYNFHLFLFPFYNFIRKVVKKA